MAQGIDGLIPYISGTRKSRYQNNCLLSVTRALDRKRLCNTCIRYSQQYRIQQPGFANYLFMASIFFFI